GSWSPDSKHLTYADKTGALFLYTLESQKTTKIDVHPFAEPLSADWSHDSAWLCYSKGLDARVPTEQIWVYNVKDGTKKRLTSGFFNDSNPTFDAKGEFIYFTSNRAFNRPTYEDVGTTFVYSDTEVLMAMPLRADVEYPMLPKSDEVEWEDDEEEQDDEGDSEEREEKSDDEETDDAGDEDESTPADETEEAESDDPVSGTWTITLELDEIPAQARTATFELTLGEDGKVTGSAIAMGQTNPIEDGTFEAASGRLIFTTVSPDGAAVSVTAVVKEGAITGEAKVGDTTIPFSGERKEAAPADDAEGDDADEYE
ncbi:MAG: hypothetical protein AAF907_02700, partial [Planctomycetota bacterium]